MLAVKCGLSGRLERVLVESLTGRRVKMEWAEERPILGQLRPVGGDPDRSGLGTLGGVCRTL